MARGCTTSVLIAEASCPAGFEEQTSADCSDDIPFKGQPPGLKLDSMSQEGQHDTTMAELHPGGSAASDTGDASESGVWL